MPLETNNEFDLIDEIVEKKNTTMLFNLKSNSAFSIALHQMLMDKHQEDPISLTDQQLNLFLCMHLENAGQADHILSFLQEGYPNYVNRIVDSLLAIGATESAKIIKEAITLLPEDGSWFFDKASEQDDILMERLDGQFSDYPDGFMCDLYRKYADENKREIINL